MNATGIQLIAAERERQVEKLRWSARHDDEEHSEGQLAWAAVCYAAPRQVFVANHDGSTYRDPWPWADYEDARTHKRDASPHDQRIRALVKAGALIAAEIDRLNRKGTP